LAISQQKIACTAPLGKGVRWGMDKGNFRKWTKKTRQGLNNRERVRKLLQFRFTLLGALGGGRGKEWEKSLERGAKKKKLGERLRMDEKGFPQ